MELSRRIYPLDPRELTEEQLAVAFAMTSRNPQPFDEIARQVTEERAADFHERWVLNYGHASVAEHAVLHMAVENVSRLACDTLEDNRLASYTEKSSRYQVLERGHYHVPSELDEDESLRRVYVGTCDALFAAYEETVDGLLAHLRDVTPRNEREREGAYNLRLRRVATDAARFLLPAATLTNVGVTLNARSMEHAIRKLLSSRLVEEREIGEELKEQGREITPTLIKYGRLQRVHCAHAPGSGGTGPALATTPDVWTTAAPTWSTTTLRRSTSWPPPCCTGSRRCRTRRCGSSVHRMDRSQLEAVVHEALDRLGPHDIPLRELEVVDYTFDLVMDYGAYREFKRHRMQTYLAQPATVDLGYIVPDIVLEAGLEQQFRDAMDAAAEGYHRVAGSSHDVASYLVTHAHLRRVLSKLNLRECYHLFKLRTSPQAHFTLRTGDAAGA